MTFHVYVFIDADDRPLYVGQSGQIRSRISQHRSVSPWWKDAARVRITAASDRDGALALEGRLIAELAPLHNVAGNPRYCRIEHPSGPPSARARKTEALIRVREQQRRKEEVAS